MPNKEANTALKWGNEPLPYNPGEPPEAWKFLTLNAPTSNISFGPYEGHYRLQGSYNGSYYGPDQIGMCPTLEEEKKRVPAGELWEPSHVIPGRNGVCSCGIHAHTLKNLYDNGEFKTDTIAHLMLPGRVRTSKNGYRSSHATVLKLYTADPLDDMQWQKAQRDLRIPIERLDIQYKTNYGSVNWAYAIENHPELQAAYQRDEDNVREYSARIAGPCPNCGNTQTTLVDSHRDLRDGFCPQCSTQWTQEEARERRKQQNG